MSLYMVNIYIWRILEESIDMILHILLEDFFTSRFYNMEDLVHKTWNLNIKVEV